MDIRRAPRSRRRGSGARGLGPTMLGSAALFVLAAVAWLTMLVAVPCVVLGWKPVTVTTGSMSPGITVGSIVLGKPYDRRAIAPGAVVTFRDPLRPGRLVTHRVIGTDLGNAYVTQGDANRTPDPTPLRPEQIVTVGRMAVPLIGLPSCLLRAGAYGQLAAIGGVLLLAVRGSRLATTPTKRSRRRGQRAVGPGVGLLATSAAALVLAGTAGAARGLAAPVPGADPLPMGSACAGHASPVTLLPTKDAAIDQKHPRLNRGSAPNLPVRTRPGTELRALFGFALPPADGCEIVSASLQLTAHGTASGGTHLASRVVTPWTERTVTWAVRPAVTGAPAVERTATSGGEIAFDVTALVRGAGSEVGFAIADRAEAAAGAPPAYASRESADPSSRPRLVIVYAPPPPDVPAPPAGR